MKSRRVAGWAYARANGHTMRHWKPAPSVRGNVYVSWCKTCDASLIWRSQPGVGVPYIEGSAMYVTCRGKRKRGISKKIVDTPDGGGMMTKV
jgi:hypothetical protein